jgi:hypothetical protein
MNYKIIWANGSENKPTLLENVKLTKELIENLEAQYGDSIISIKPTH